MRPDPEGRRHDWLDDEPDGEPDDGFPLGDGTADTEAMVVCPYCGQPVDIALDPAGGSDQRYEEDCEVCCRTWQVHVRYARDGHAAVTVTALDD